MTEATGESPSSADFSDRYGILGMVLAEAGKRLGVTPKAVEEKATVEAQRAAEQVLLDDEPVPWTVSNDCWAKGKMETPGVQFYTYEQTLHLAVSDDRGAEALTRIHAYWLSRGMNIISEADSPTNRVVASPGKGEWMLYAGPLDSVTVFIQVSSGPVLTSSNPLRNDKKS